MIPGWSEYRTVKVGMVKTKEFKERGEQGKEAN